MNIEKELSKIFIAGYNELLSHSKRSVLAQNADFEIYPCLAVIFDFASVNAECYRREINNITSKLAHQYLVSHSNYTKETFDARSELYGKAIRGMLLRGEWLDVDLDEIVKTAMDKCAVVLLDIMYNPKCAGNYIYEPIIVKNFMDRAVFAATVGKPIMLTIRRIYLEVFYILNFSIKYSSSSIFSKKNIYERLLKDYGSITPYLYQALCYDFSLQNNMKEVNLSANEWEAIYDDLMNQYKKDDFSSKEIFSYIGKNRGNVALKLEIEKSFQFNEVDSIVRSNILNYVIKKNAKALFNENFWMSEDISFSQEDYSYAINDDGALEFFFETQEEFIVYCGEFKKIDSNTRDIVWKKGNNYINLLNEGIRYFEEHNYELAISKYEEALKYNPMGFAARMDLCNSYVRLGQFDMVKKQLVMIHKYLYSTKLIAWFYRQLGFVLSEEKHFMEALACELYSVKFENSSLAKDEIAYIKSEAGVDMEDKDIVPFLEKNNIPVIKKAVKTNYEE